MRFPVVQAKNATCFLINLTVLCPQAKAAKFVIATVQLVGR